MSDKERFAAHGWNLDSIEDACAELDRLSAMARGESAKAISLQGELVALYEAADNWWTAWAKAERWNAFCQEGCLVPERPEAERIFAEEFSGADFDEDEIDDQLQFAEDALVESVRQAATVLKRKPFAPESGVTALGGRRKG